MWLTSLVTAGATSFGRLFVVNLLPNALVLLISWFFIRAGSFAGKSDWARLLPVNLKIDAMEVLLFMLAVVVMATILQPFQIRMVRLLEGYWQAWGLTACLAPFFSEIQRRRLSALRDLHVELVRRDKRGIDRNRPAGEQAAQSRSLAKERAALARIKLRIQRFPAFQDDTAGSDYEQIPLLPTALGNALRTAETSAGERYGLNTILSWPRLYPHFSKEFAAVYHAARDAVDAATNLCISFFVSGVIALVSLVDEPKAYWIPLGLFLLAGVSYVGAVAAAAQHTIYLRVAYDLHRFDMVKAMHQKLPTSTLEEFKLNATLTRLFEAEQMDSAQYGLVSKAEPALRYDHSDESDTTDGDQSAKA